MTYLHNITMRDNITVVAKVITDIYLALHSQENCMIYDMETENSEERDTMLNGVALDSIKRYVRLMSLPEPCTLPRMKHLNNKRQG